MGDAWGFQVQERSAAPHSGKEEWLDAMLTNHGQPTAAGGAGRQRRLDTQDGLGSWTGCTRRFSLALARSLRRHRLYRHDWERLEGFS